MHLRIETMHPATHTRILQISADRAQTGCRPDKFACPVYKLDSHPWLHNPVLDYFVDRADRLVPGKATYSVFRALAQYMPVQLISVQALSRTRGMGEVQASRSARSTARSRAASGWAVCRPDSSRVRSAPVYSRSALSTGASRCSPPDCKAALQQEVATTNAKFYPRRHAAMHLPEIRLDQIYDMHLVYRLI